MLYAFTFGTRVVARMRTNGVGGGSPTTKRRRPAPLQKSGTHKKTHITYACIRVTCACVHIAVLSNNNIYYIEILRCAFFFMMSTEHAIHSAPSGDEYGDENDGATTMIDSLCSDATHGTLRAMMIIQSDADNTEYAQAVYSV